MALVAGASSGIGEATALALAAEGVRVAATARRRDRLEALVKVTADCCAMLVLQCLASAFIGSPVRSPEAAGGAVGTPAMPVAVGLLDGGGQSGAPGKPSAVAPPGSAGRQRAYGSLPSVLVEQEIGTVSAAGATGSSSSAGGGTAEEPSPTAR